MSHKTQHAEYDYNSDFYAWSLHNAALIRQGKLHENKSHIITELMKQAIEEQERKQRRAAAIETLLTIRNRHKKVSSKVIKASREKGRP
jgi:hypothetical protein